LKSRRLQGGVIITLLTIIDSWEKSTYYRRGSPTEKEILCSDRGWRLRGVQGLGRRGSGGIGGDTHKLVLFRFFALKTQLIELKCSLTKYLQIVLI